MIINKYILIRNPNESPNIPVIDNITTEIEFDLILSIVSDIVSSPLLCCVLLGFIEEVHNLNPTQSIITIPTINHFLLQNYFRFSIVDFYIETMLSSGAFYI